MRGLDSRSFRPSTRLSSTPCHRAGCVFFTPTKTETPTLRTKMNSASTWPLRTVARAANMKPRALRQWLDTGVITLRGNDRRSTGSGDHCGLSRQRAYQAAITQTLSRQGVSVSRAAHDALLFTDQGQTGRAPGNLFECGRTWLLIDPEGPTVKNHFHDSTFTDVSKGAVSLIGVDLNKVVEQVDAILNNA